MLLGYVRRSIYLVSSFLEDRKYDSAGDFRRYSRCGGRYGGDPAEDGEEGVKDHVDGEIDR